ncbi:UNVERIFIED_CONTAM: hypothetical protein FKN15_051455 [Acipenser sinensis]
MTENMFVFNHRPPTVVLDLFTDVRDGNRLLDLLEVISGQPMIKLVNINIPDIIEGKPSIVLGLIWTIILHFHHRPPTVVLDLFTDVRDGNRLLDLLEVISGQPMSRERGRSIFQCRANIETALTFLRRKSIKLVNINIPDIIEGKPSIVLGLIWTIILHFHIEELANSLAFSSRQSSMESLASIDSCSTIDSSSSRRSGTLHTKFKLSAKKALLLWAREQCQKAGANISIKDFKSSWRSGLAFLAILNSLRPDLVDLQKTKSRTNRENLEEAFRTAEHELKIPRLLEPEDVDINDPDDKSIMTYVAQFLQYSKDLPVSEEEMQDFVEKQSFVTCLEAATEKLKLIASNYTSRTALAADSQYINKFLKQVDCDSSVSLASIRNVKAILARVVSGWDTYTENYNLLQQWLKEAQAQTQIHTAEVMSDWSTRHGRLNEAGNFLMEVTNEQTSSQLSEELKKLNRQWADFIKRTTFEIIPQPCESPRKTDNTAAINIMIDEATQILNERVDISASSLRTYIKRLEIADKCSGVQQDCQLLLSHVDTLESRLALLELWESEAGDIFNSLNTKQKGQEIDKKSLQETLTRSETNILEEFLEASEQMKQITPSNQQQEVEKISRYLREQWDAIHVEIPLYLHLMKFEVEKGKCNGAVSQCEMQINKEIKLINSACIAGLIKEHQACFSPEGSLGQADDHLQAMKGICEKLTADTSYSVTKTQLTESEQRKEEIEQRARHVYENLLTRHNEQQSSEKRHVFLLCHQVLTWLLVALLCFYDVYNRSYGFWQSSGHAELKVADVDSPVEAVSSVSSKVLLTTTQVTVRVANIPVVQQAVKLNVEEAVPAVQDKQDSNETEVLKSYRESKSVFEVQLKKNRELILSEFPEDMVDTSVLRIKCQELQAAQEETETFWFEFEIQSSQLKGNMREPETRKRINHEWRELKPSLQARLKSMETTVGILVPVEIQVTQLSDLLEQYQKKPKTLKRFTVTGADSVQKDIKELQERIQRHIVNSSVLEKPGSPSVAGLDSRDQLAIHKIVLVCKKKLQKMIYSIHDSEVVMKTLEAFLASLRTAENDIDRLQAAPSADVVALRKSKVKLEVSQKDINFMRDKAVHIDELLNKAEIRQQEAESSKAMTCQQMIAVLSQKLEDTKVFIMKHEQNLQQEEVLRPILVRKEDLIKNLWEAQQKTNSEGLKELTLPAIQQRLKSMETAVGFLVPLDNEVAQLSDSLDQFKKKPKTLKRFTMPGAASVQKDLKELQRRIQRNIRNSSAFEKLESPAAAGLDPRDQQAIQSIVLVCKNKLEEMDHSVHDSEVAMKTLEAFLASLRTAENDIDRLQAAPSSDVVSLRKSKVELEAIQQDINSMRDKAVHIDELLNKAEIRLQEAESSKGMTCQQMIAVLSQKLEDTREFIMKHEQSLQQEVLRSILVKKNALMTRLQEVQQKTDSEGLKEPTLPALQQRLRSLKELRNNLGSFEGELLKLRETANQLVLMSSEEKAKHLMDLETLWEETERSVTDRLKSMETAVGFLVPLDNEVAQLSDSLDQFKKKPKTLKRFTMPGAASVQKDLKELLESTQCYIRNNSAFEKLESLAAAGLDPRDQQAIQSIVLVCKNKLEEIDHSVHDSEVAMKTLEAFLASLRTAENDIDRLQAAPSSDVVSLRKSKVELEAIQQDINSMRDKAVHIDELLNKAEIRLQEAESSKGMTCQQMIAVLSQKLEDTKEFIMKHEQSLQQEVLRSILVKKNALMTRLQEVQEKADSVGLMEPTLPALHKRQRRVAVDRRSDVWDSRGSGAVGRGNGATSRGNASDVCLLRSDVFLLRSDVWDSRGSEARDQAGDCAWLYCDLGARSSGGRSGHSGPVSTLPGEGTALGNAGLACRGGGTSSPLTSTGDSGNTVSSPLGSESGGSSPLGSGSGGSSPLGSGSGGSSPLGSGSGGSSPLGSGSGGSSPLGSGGGVSGARLACSHLLEQQLQFVMLLSIANTGFISRLRILEELENQMRSCEGDLQRLRERAHQIPLTSREEETMSLVDLDTLWEETERTVTKGQEQCSVLMGLLKKFQGYRSDLSNTLQRAETTISEQASYMGKDNLHRLIEKVGTMKEELSGSSDHIDEIRTVCRQLQSQLKKIQSCKDTAFESEADSLVDRWLDVTEKTDIYLDNIKCGLTLWEKLISSASDIEEWTAIKLGAFSEHHRFRNQQEITDLEDFLMSEDGEKKIHNIKKRFSEIRTHLPVKHVNQISGWLQDQEAELKTFTSHCQQKHRDLQDCLESLNKLQEEYTLLDRWLQSKVQKSLPAEGLEQFYQEIVKQREKFDGLSSIVDSLRKQGLTYDQAVKESSKLIERYQNLLVQIAAETEAQEALSKDLEAFDSLRDRTLAWITGLKESIDTVLSTEGSKSMIEERIQRTEEILQRKPEGDLKIQLLNDTGTKLTEKMRLDNRRSPETKQTIVEITGQWNSAFQSAEEHCSHLKEILGRWNSYLEAKEKVQLKISEISQQKLDLSVEFVWPDLTGKYESLEKCRMLLQEAHSILTAFDMLKVQKDALFHLTHDVNFNEASWVEMLNPNYCLLKDLKGLVHTLEDSIERHHCYQKLLKEFHTTQDSFSEEIPSLRATPKERPALEKTLDRLKGTKNTLDRLESRVENLKADQQFCTSQQMLPEATVAAAEVIQKYYSLLSQASDGLHSSKVTLENRFFKPLQALQQWTLTAKSALCVQTHLSPDSALATSTIQDLLNHREMLKKELKDVLPYQELLMDAVGQEQSEKLATEISNTLQEENQYTSTLCQELQTIKDQNKHAEEGNYQLIDCPDEEVGAEVEQTLQPDLLEQQIQTSETHQDILVPPGEGQKELIEVRSAEQLQIDTGGQEKMMELEMSSFIASPGTFGDILVPPGEGQKELIEVRSAKQLQIDTGGQEKMMELEMSSFIASPGTFGETKRYEDKHKCEEVAGSATVTGLNQEQTPLPDLPVEQQLIQTRQEVSRDFEQKQAAALKQMKAAEVSELRTVTQTDVEHIQAQWNKHVQDLSSLKQSKESQLSLIKEYHCSADAVKHLFEKLSAELETLEQGPVESCSFHAETVQKILSTIEQEKVILQELGEKQEQISHHLNETEKKALQIQLEHWDQKGNQMASAAERTLYVVSKEVEEYRCLLLESQELQKQVDNLELSLTDLKGSPPEEEIDKRESWMILSADLTAAQHNFTHLKRSSQILIQHMLGQREKDSLENSVHQLQARLDLMQEQALAHSEEEETSSATTISKVMKVMKEAFTWVKKADGDITANNRIALFPEDVSVQIKNLKELQSEIIAKQSAMDSFVSEVKVLMSGLDEKDVHKVSYLLQTLIDLHKSAAQKSTQKLHELESALQARERLFEKIASINTWLEAHTEKEHIKENDSESNTLELEHQVKESNDILHKFKEQEMLLESLLVNSKEISAEINISENYYLSDRLKCLQNNIKRVITSQKMRCWNVEEMLNTRKNTEGKLESLACDLKETMSYMNIDGILLSKDAVSTRNALKLKILEHKSQLDQLCSCEYFQKEKLSELQSLLADTEKKMKKLNSSIQEYEKYQTVLQNIEHLKERAEKEILHIKEAPGFKIDKLKRCQVLLLDLQQWMLLCQQSGDTLNKISPTLDPTLLDSEEQRIQYLVEECNKWNQALQKESLDLEKQLLEEQDFQTVQESTLDFLREARHELASSCMSLDQEVIERKLQECKALQNYMQVLMRILKSLEHKELESLKKAASDSPGTTEKKCNEMEDMEREVKDDCASRMDILIKAKEAAREYDEAVRSAAGFLCQSEASLLPRPINVSFCELQLQQHQENLSKCHAGFESKISDMQQILPRLESIPHTFLPQHANILSELLVRNAVLRGQAEIKRERMQRCVEKYKNYKEYKQEISTNFNNLERMFATSISQKATSYKESLEQLEKLKILVAKLDSMEDLVKLRAIASELQSEEWDSSGIKQEVSALWYAWLQLQQPAKEHQVSCENLNKEWKAVNENIERAAIILDNLQDDLPECSKEKAAKEDLLDLQKHVNQYEDSVNNEQSSLVFLVHKVKGLLGVTENFEVPSIPICQKLQEMQDRYKKLKQKAMKSRKSVDTEIQEREKVKDEIRGVKEWLLHVVSLLSVVDHTPNITELEEVQTELDTQRAAVKNIMAKLKIKYSNMDAIVPAEIEAQLQEVSRTLQEVGEQVEKAVVQNSHHHLLHNKIEDITNGLHNVDKMLQQKSQTINQAKEMQKRVWDEVDRWHSRLTSLEAEVQDLAEQNPNQAQQMMDSLMEPLQLYQRAAQQAEQRTAFLSKITNCLQEYNEMINSSNVWIDDTQAWLSMEFVFDSAKSLHKNVKALQIASDDGLQRQKTLQGFAPILQEISLVCDTMALEEQGSHVDQKITALLEGIMGPLSQLQHVATVILENIQSMKKTIAEIKNYEPREAIASLVVFKRAEQLLPAMEELEHTTVQQKAVLRSAIEQLIGQRQNMEIAVQEEYPDEMSTSPAEYTQLPTGFRIPQIPAEGYSIDRLYYEGPDTGSEDGGSTKSSSSETLTGSILESAIEQLIGQRQNMEIAVQEEYPDEMSTSPAEYTQPPTGFRIPQIPAEGYSIDRLYYEGPDTGSEDGGSTKSSSSETLTGSILEEPEEPHTPEDLNTENTSSVQLEAEDNETSSMQPVPHEEAGPGELQQLPGRPEPHSILHVCRERAAQLEIWLEKATATFRADRQDMEMQQSVAQQLLMCQSMFLEIEQKVAFLSDLAQQEEAWCQEGTASTHQEAEALSSKLEGLKSSLVKFQMLLQERHNEEQDGKHPSETPLQRSASVQEMLASAKTKLNRQDSLQQQKVSVTTRSCPIADNLATYSIRSPNVPELKTYITQLRELSQEATVILSQACPSKESCSELDQNLHNVLNGTNLSFSCIEDVISGCYEMSREDAKLQLSQLENLPTELADLHTELSGSKEPLIQCVSLTGGEEAVLSDCLNSLQSCLCLLQSAVSSRSTLLQARLDHITDYQAEIRQMHASLFDKRSVLLQALNEASGQSIAMQLQVAEQLESTLPPEECQVSALKEQGERLHLQAAVIQEVCKLEDVLDNTWSTLRVAREELKESLTTEIQYESLLQGLSSLVDAGHEKLARNQHLVLPSRTELKNHLKKHKGLSSLVDAGHEKLARNQHLVLPSRTELKNHLKKHKAWTHFDKSSTVLLKELQELEARIPTVGLVEESEERLLERLAIYQQIKGSLDENCSRLSQTLTNGKKLLTTVSCTELESGLRQLEEKWLAVMNRVDHDSHCLETLTKYWSSFRKGSIELSVWMTSAMDRLKSLKQQSLSVPQDLEKEFMKEVDAKSSVKSSLISTGNQLLQVKQADTASLQNQLAQFEQGWTEVLTPLPGIQEKLHQLQMEKVPSRQAITELKTWMSEIHGILREDEEKISHLSTTASAKEILQKYKDYKTEMNCKQLTMDFVNQSVLQISSLDIQSKRYDMAEFAECLGALNLQWQLLQGALSSKMQAVEHMLAVFTEKERKMQLISCWCKAQEERILGFQTPASLTSAENALKDCQEIEEKLKIKSKEIQELKHCYLSPAEDSSEHLHIDFIAQVDEVYADWTSLNNRVIQTKASLQSTVQQWKAFDETFQEVDLNIIKARVKKLKETQVTVQQLDKNMSNLRTWLSHIEAELSKPVVYNICDHDEIQKKLSEQQDLQRDIEQHTDGVASVINLCDVLLHDSDACATETECDSIQQTTASLDRRWRNICAMSMERRMKIEETCRLWSKFLDDYSRFEDWLKTAERTAACPNSAEVLYTSAKEELKKFEAFQRQVHERLTQLELVNKQYRRLARENRTDTASRLKLMVHEGNQRWDNLQKRVAAILRRLKYFTSQREEFEGTRDGILVWLTEMDLQLTNVEHFSESDIEDKMRQLEGFQQEITLNTNKIDQLIVFGENLIQKSQPLDAVLIEDELEELHSYCQEVFGRVARFHHRLINKGPVSEDEKESSDRDTDLEDSAELQGIGWQEKMGHEVSPSCQSTCQLMPPTPGQERSGRETPISVDSIPLEWDHTVDVGGSSSHEDEEEPVYYSALSVKSPSEPPSWHSPDHQDSRKQRIQTEIIRNLSSTSPTTSTPYKLGYVKLMSECSGSIDSVKRVKLILNDEEQLEEQGLVGLTTVEKQSGVIERWELIQAQGLSNKLRKKQNLQQWQQLNSDLHDITSWMKQIEPELDELQKLESSTSIQDIEGNIKKLKEIQKAFDNYKSVVISLNLISKDFQQADSDESQELHGRLGLMNQSWVQACNKLDCWKEGLQTALMQCQDFHETTHDLLLWLAHAVSRRYTVDLADSSIKSCVLQEHQKTLMQLEGDLLEKQLQVSSLQEISTHLLVKADEEDHIEAKEKVHVIENKLKLLLREVSQDMQTIQKKLVLFLLLLILACLVPLTEEDYSCTLSNNFARSFYPMLRYTNGPPPT